VTEVHFYRLELSPEIEAFRGEIEYALDFVAESYPIRLDPSADRVLRYPGDLPARLFPEAVSVAEDGLRLNRAAFEALDGFWPVEGTSQRSLGYDAIGIIFFMLSRIEERDAPSYDRHGRFEPEQAASVRRGLHAQPLADRAAADIAFFLTGMRLIPMREFELIPTHDVDILKGYHRWWEPLRYAAGDLLKRRAPGSALGRFSAYGTGEPFVSFRDMMALSERFGLKSRFYMMGPSQDPMDSPYVATMKGLLSRLSREILARGHRIAAGKPGAGQHLARTDRQAAAGPDPGQPVLHFSDHSPLSRATAGGWRSSPGSAGAGWNRPAARAGWARAPW